MTGPRSSSDHAGAGPAGSPRVVRRLLIGLFSDSEAWTVPDPEVERVRAEFSDVSVAHARTQEEFEAGMADVEILFSWVPGDALARRAERLRWIHAPSAGVGAFLTPTVLERAIPVTNSRGCHAVPIAEHVLGMLTALARRLRPGIEEQTTTGLKREHWWLGAEIPVELRGRTLGLYGYGAIGREIARRALAFGMRVVALRRHPDRPPDWDPALLRALDLPAEEPRVDRMLGPDGLGILLEESDAIVISAALTRETEGVFDARAFARMKRGAWFLNIARGKIAREADLIGALASGHLGGAGLDVFETEPLPRESGLYALRNVILTPHVSGLSTGFWPRAMALFRENLRRDGAGTPLLNLVSHERGY